MVPNTADFFAYFLPQFGGPPGPGTRQGLEDTVGLAVPSSPETLTSEAFERWLHSDPRHVTAFNRMANEWAAAGDLVMETAAATSFQTNHRTPRRAARLPGLRAPWIAGGLGTLAAAAAALVLFVQPLIEGTATVGYATETGDLAETAMACFFASFLKKLIIKILAIAGTLPTTLPVISHYECLFRSRCALSAWKIKTCRSLCMFNRGGLQTLTFL